MCIFFPNGGWLFSSICSKVRMKDDPKSTIFNNTIKAHRCSCLSHNSPGTRVKGPRQQELWLHIQLLLSMSMRNSKTSYASIEILAHDHAWKICSSPEDAWPRAYAIGLSDIVACLREISEFAMEHRRLIGKYR